MQNEEDSDSSGAPVRYARALLTCGLSLDLSCFDRALSGVTDKTYKFNCV